MSSLERMDAVDDFRDVPGVVKVSCLKDVGLVRTKRKVNEKEGQWTLRDVGQMSKKKGTSGRLRRRMNLKK